jgi:hypothetical protein
MLKNCETHGTFIRSTRECWDMVVSTMRPPPCAAEEMDQFMEKCAAEQLVLQKGGRKWEFDKHLV